MKEREKPGALHRHTRHHASHPSREVLRQSCVSAGLLASGSSYLRVLPRFPQWSAGRRAGPAFVPGYSCGAARESHPLPLAVTPQGRRSWRRSRRQFCLMVDSPLAGVYSRACERRPRLSATELPRPGLRGPLLDGRDGQCRDARSLCEYRVGRLATRRDAPARGAGARPPLCCKKSHLPPANHDFLRIAGCTRSLGDARSGYSHRLLAPGSLPGRPARVE